MLLRLAVLSLSLAIASAFSSIGPTTIDGTAYDFQATVFVGGIPNSNTVGPVGIVWDDQGNTYISYYASNEILKFAAGAGGMPSSSNLLWRRSTSPYNLPCGFAFSKAGQLYVGFQSGGYIVRVDMSTGDLHEDLLASIPGAVRGGVTALANDPISHDMYYDVVGNAVYRITGTGVGETPAIYTYTSNSFGCGIDGIYFDSAGTIYFAACSRIWTAPYKPAPQSTTASALASVNTVDGTAATSDGKLVAGVRNDGIVTVVSPSSGSLTDVYTGGSRGDLGAVGPDGCFYFTQTDTVIKLTDLPDGKCNFVSTTTNGGCKNSSNILIYGTSDPTWGPWFQANIPGSTVTQDTTMPTITKAYFQQYDLVIIAQVYNRLITAAESQAALDYLNSGGAIIALAGFTNDGNDIAHQEAIFQSLGVHYGTQLITLGATLNYNPSNPLTPGLAPGYVDFVGGWASTPYTGPGTTELFASGVSVYDQRTYSIGQTITLPSGGRIVTWGDEWATFTGRYGLQGNEDAQFWKNAVAWVSGICVPGSNPSPCEAEKFLASTSCTTATHSSSGKGFTLSFSSAVSNCS